VPLANRVNGENAVGHADVFVHIVLEMVRDHESPATLRGCPTSTCSEIRPASGIRIFPDSSLNRVLPVGGRVSEGDAVFVVASPVKKATPNYRLDNASAMRLRNDQQFVIIPSLLRSLAKTLFGLFQCACD
jgi:hypothetical protein